MLLSLFMMEVEAFEWFFDFTRSHESWELDEIVSVALSALITGAIWFGIDSRQKGNEIKRIYEENLKNERRMSDARRVQALGTLAGGVAHSGNNLMQPILTLARISKDQLDSNSPVHGHLDRIIVAAQSAGELFHSILKFSREETGFSQRVDFGDLIRENESLLTAALPKNNQLVIELSPTPVVALVSSNNFLDILLALISNSADAYKGESGQIQIITHNSPPWSQLIIRDQGCGISTEDLERIFEPFFTNKDVGMGTGLGLPVVKSLVEDAGGQVHVESRHGDGTSVIVNLPIDKATFEREEQEL